MKDRVNLNTLLLAVLLCFGGLNSNKFRKTVNEFHDFMIEVRTELSALQKAHVIYNSDLVQIQTQLAQIQTDLLKLKRDNKLK